MATLKELEAQVDDLKIALDAEQKQVQDLRDEKDATITSLNGIITGLQAQVAEGGTPEERQAVLDKMIALKEDLVSTVEDAQASPEVGENTNG